MLNLANIPKKKNWLVYFRKENFVIYKLLLHLKNLKRGLKNMKFESDGFWSRWAFITILGLGESHKKMYLWEVVNKEVVSSKKTEKEFYDNKRWYTGRLSWGLWKQLDYMKRVYVCVLVIYVYIYNIIYWIL